MITEEEIKEIEDIMNIIGDLILEENS